MPKTRHATTSLNSQLVELRQQLRNIENRLPSDADAARAELDSAIATVIDMLATGARTARRPDTDDAVDLPKADTRPATATDIESLLRSGRWDELELRLEVLARRPLDPVAEMRVACVAGRLHSARGNSDFALSCFQRARAIGRRLGSHSALADLYVGYAELELWRGEADAASTWIDEGMQEVSSPVGIPALCSMGARAAADRAECARALGNLPEAQRAEQVAAEWHERALATDCRQGLDRTAHLATCRAEAARASGRPEPPHWEASVLRWRHDSRPYAAAYAGFRHAEALLLSGTERPRAQLVLEEALAASTKLAAGSLTRRLCALAVRVQPGTPTHEASQTTTAHLADKINRDAFGLTKRELEVLRLVVAGLTNREISRALFISRHTVGVHVSHILAKLGVSNRVLAAAAGYRMGLAAPSPNRRNT